MRSQTFAATMVASAFAAQTSANIYIQESDRNDSPSFFSDAVPGQFFSQRMADNFTLSSDASATAIRWWGGSQNFQFADTNNMASYTVVLYASDSSGAPDESAILFEATVDSETNGFDQAATGVNNFNGGIEYRYTLELDHAIALTAGTQYWISVGATLVNPGADAWVWAGSTQGDLVNATDFFNGSGYSVFDPTFNDLAFAIVPAPGAIAFLIPAAILGTRRRR